MSGIKCIPPEQLIYPTGEVVIKFTVTNEYKQKKTIRVKIYYCEDSGCTKAYYLGSTNDSTLEPGAHDLTLQLTLNKPGYYGIIVFNVDDNKDECGFVIQVVTQMEYIMQQVFNFIPAVMGMSVAIVIAKEMGEALGGIGGG